LYNLGYKGSLLKVITAKSPEVLEENVNNFCRGKHIVTKKYNSNVVFDQNEISKIAYQCFIDYIPQQGAVFTNADNVLDVATSVNENGEKTRYYDQRQKIEKSFA